jgi:hypothetical protein
MGYGIPEEVGHTVEMVGIEARRRGRHVEIRRDRVKLVLMTREKNIGKSIQQRRKMVLRKRDAMGVD